MKKIAIIIGVIITGILIAILFVGGYLGVVPLFATVMGATTPRDLGVRYTAQHANDFDTRSQVIVDLVSQDTMQSNSVVFSGSQPIDTTFTQEEISARLHFDPWVYQVIENVQVRTNADGTVELSGNINLEKIDEFLQASGYSVNKADIEAYVPYFDMIKVKPAIYIKATPSVRDNVARAGFIEARVASFTITADQYNAGPLFDDWANTLLQTVDGAELDEVRFDQYGAHLKGSLPQTVSILTDY